MFDIYIIVSKINSNIQTWLDKLLISPVTFKGENLHSPDLIIHSGPFSLIAALLFELS